MEAQVLYATNISVSFSFRPETLAIKLFCFAVQLDFNIVFF